MLGGRILEISPPESILFYSFMTINFRALISDNYQATVTLAKRRLPT